MRFTEQFELPVSPDAAFQLLLDLDRVIPCVPGASLGDEQPDGARGLTMAVKLGPMRFNYEGTVRVAEQDPAARRAVLAGAARETRGQGSADGSVTMQVEGEGERAVVSAALDARLSGRAAQMGQGVVESVAREITRQMTRCLESKLTASATASSSPAAAAGGASSSAGTATATATAERAATSTAAAEPAQAPMRVLPLLWAALRSWVRRWRKST
jgi:carbon monoxide dehydrogenase subunit G